MRTPHQPNDGRDPASIPFHGVTILISREDIGKRRSYHIAQLYDPRKLDPIRVRQLRQSVRLVLTPDAAARYLQSWPPHDALRLWVTRLSIEWPHLPWFVNVTSPWMRFTALCCAGNSRSIQRTGSNIVGMRILWKDAERLCNHFEFGLIDVADAIDLLDEEWTQLRDDLVTNIMSYAQPSLD